MRGSFQAMRSDLVILKGIYCHSDSQPSFSLYSFLRRPQPVVVAIGASTGGSRIPATSFPSSSTLDTNIVYAGLSFIDGGYLDKMPLSKWSPKSRRYRVVISPF